MALSLTRDAIFRVVCNLRTPIQAGGMVVGTGMFIVKDQIPYILTASHVACGCNKNSTIVLCDNASNSMTYKLIDFNPALSWKHNSVADISILKVVPTSLTMPVMKDRCFPYEQLNMSNNPPSRDAYLTAVGFPNGLGTQGKFSPFTFRSHASSGLITLARFDNTAPCDFFTLENPSVGGYSGGPVFELGYIIVGAMTTTTGPTICHGIMHGTIGDTTGGKIAAVTPCSYIPGMI